MSIKDNMNYEFHISLECRKKYGFEGSIYGLAGNVILADYAAIQRLADRMNAVRDAASNPHLTVKASEINIIALIEEILHLVVAEYRRQKNPTLLAQTMDVLAGTLGDPAVSDCLAAFTGAFPPMKVFQGELTVQDYLSTPAGSTAALEELLFLFLSNDNPAYRHYSELFDDASLRKGTKYLESIDFMKEFFQTQPKFGPQDLDLFTLLKSPALASPYSLSGQLDYIKQNWKDILPADVFEKLLERMLRAIDVLQETERFRGFTPGLEPLPDYRKIFSSAEGSPGPEPEKYSPDLDWMPNLVMMAKNTYVWLDQLSQKYQREIRHLDQIPDEELSWLAESGFTGLWLIGVWERSSASQKIKQICGNPEAVSSAYSLYEYRIADDLGGDGAYYSLKDRAMHRGIRLAVDMVPNHTGLFSKWVIEHPEWFIQVDQPPYPAYSFNGPDLSGHPDIGLFLEDGYYSRRDAAVVFKRVDNRNGRVRYIYHGNDGTHMPWNDTAQLNFLLPDLREAVISEVLRVARYSSVIRFDAAMTLAKKHYQRLWFPQPGSGGDIPSRSWHGLSKADFDRAFPAEFWREVVERVAVEAPDTLLLAEAFWLMEGYFVRSLGMHRVYNSAFMNMLKREENANYRTVIRNLMEFDPQIIKRFVNFMNNPDEEPAVAQFGKGDKYFGVCVMMSTLPGLPMFGHGQIEGFAEKYGMEYRRAYWNEVPDQNLVDRHRREVFPLLKKRYLFSQVDRFAFYDVISSQGHNQHDLFAYSNASGGEQALVVYNNRYQRVDGWINWSVPYKKSGDTELSKSKLAEQLGFSSDGWIVFRDMLSGLEYIRPARQIWDSGLYVQMNGFQCHVFTDFRHQSDPSGEYSILASRLKGNGTTSIEHSLWEQRMEKLLDQFDNLMLPLKQPKMLAEILDNGIHRISAEKQIHGTLSELIPEAGKIFDLPSGSIPDAAILAKRIFELYVCRGFNQRPKNRRLSEFMSLTGKRSIDERDTALFYALNVFKVILPLIPQPQAQELLWGRMESILTDGLLPETEGYYARLLLEIMAEEEWDWSKVISEKEELNKFLERPKVLQYLGCNWYRNVLWFNKERFQHLIFCLVMIGLNKTANRSESFKRRKKSFLLLRQAFNLILLAEDSNYDYRRFTDLLDENV